MTSLLVIIVLVLLAVALWQLSKIFDLTQVGANANSEVATDKDNTLNGYLMFAFLGFIYIFTIYSLWAWGGLILGQSASAHGPMVDTLMNISWVLIFIVQVLTQGLLHYFAFKYRGKEGQKALYFSDSNKLEMLWSIIPSVTLAGLILFGLYAWTEIMFFDEEEDHIVVEVYAKQFSWEVRYAGEDNVLGKANVRLIEGINTMGVDMADPNAQDDITATAIHLPKGKKVLFKFRSQDVLHSAYFPHFRAQMNVVPGMVTQFAFEPTVTTEDMRNTKEMKDKVANINTIRAERSKDIVAKGGEALDPYEFDYLLICNKICGTSHYNMQLKVVVQEQADFDAWLKEQTVISASVKAEKEKDAAPADVITPAIAPVAVDSTAVVALN